LPYTGVLWIAAFLAIIGAPPFGIFSSEFTILRGLTAGGRSLETVLYLLFLAIIFVGMASICLRMVQGSISPGAVDGTGTAHSREPVWSWLPPACLLAICLCLGLYIPEPLRDLLHGATLSLDGIFPF
jgi:hydrogenase-4 component F